MPRGPRDLTCKVSRTFWQVSTLDSVIQSSPK